MFLGHYAVGLASKKFAPRASLGALIAAPILLDLLWPIFLLTGWEHVSIDSNRNPFLRLVFDYYPVSHGLVAVVGWATLFASLYFGFARYAAGSIAIWIAVVSHWLLDYVVHRPDLPLYAHSRLFGLGLWNHRWWTIAIELLMFVVAIWIYLRQTKAEPSTRVGNIAFWAFVVVLLWAYGFAAFGPAPPQGIKKLAFGTLLTALFIPWAWWFDRNRTARADEALPAARESKVKPAAG